MNYRGLIILGIAWVVFGCQPKSNQIEDSAKKDQRPNIIYIMADDMGYSDLGCYGSEINTPNLDRLANNGVRFTKFYNAARCCPSRAALLTGQQPHQAGMGAMVKDLGHPSYRGFLSDSVATIAEVLKESGYSTYHVGKWHVGDHQGHWPVNRGFDKDYTFINGAGSFYNLWPYRRGAVDSMQMSYNGVRYRPPNEGFFMTDAFTDHALEFIEAEDEKPFFMYLAYKAPHWPLHAFPEDIAKYEQTYAIGWDSLRMARYSKMKELGIIPTNSELSARTPDLPAWETLSGEEKEVWQTKMTLYAAMIDRMDQNIGRLVNRLEEKGKLDNTLIVFLSDNGASPERIRKLDYPTDGEPGSERSFPWYGAHWANVSNTPYRYYKAWLQEGGMISPFIAHWPKRIKKAQINSNTLGHITDLMATALDVAEVQYPQELNGRYLKPTYGRSLVLAFNDHSEAGHKKLFWEHLGNRAMRKGDWKLIGNKNEITVEKGWTEGVGWQLFNLKEDPSEINNVISEHPEIANEMIAEHDAWMKENNILFPQDYFALKKQNKNSKH